MQATPEEMWERFIEQLNAEMPLGSKKEPLPHKSFIGSISRYKKIFLDANKVKE